MAKAVTAVMTASTTTRGAAVNYQWSSVTESPKLPTAYPTSETRVQKTMYPISGTRVQKTLSEASTIAQATLIVVKIVEKKQG